MYTRGPFSSPECVSALQETLDRILEPSFPLEVELPLLNEARHTDENATDEYLESMPLRVRVSRNINASLKQELRADRQKRAAYIKVTRLLAKIKNEALLVTDLAPQALLDQPRIVSAINTAYACPDSTETIERVCDISRMLIHHAVAKRTILEDQHRSAEDEKNLSKEAYADAFARGILNDPDLDAITAAYLTEGILSRLEAMQEKERKTA